MESTHPKMRRFFYTISKYPVQLFAIVETKNGKRLLKSYGEHHGTPLDSLIESSFQEPYCDHPDNQIEVIWRFQGWVSADFLGFKEVVNILSQYFNATPIKLKWDDWFELSSGKKTIEEVIKFN